MRWRTIVFAPPRSASRPISPSRSSRGPCSPRCGAGWARVTPPRYSTEMAASAVAGHPRRRLALDVGVAYLCAWLVGIGYGMLIRGSDQWDHGAEWERSLLRWIHAQQLPPWLDSIVLWVPLTGTNLTILPGILLLGWWMWKRARRPLIALQLLVVCVGSL